MQNLSLVVITNITTESTNHFYFIYLYSVSHFHFTRLLISTSCDVSTIKHKTRTEWLRVTISFQSRGFQDKNCWVPLPTWMYKHKQVLPFKAHHSST